MAAKPPQIHTYHCLCTSLLLTSTHALSSLPRRKTAPGSLQDAAIILPLPSAPPDLTAIPSSTSRHQHQEEAEEQEQEDEQTNNNNNTKPPTTKEKGKQIARDIEANIADIESHLLLPPAGYSILLGLQPDRKPTIIRREDGFERRVLYRCMRCRLVAGYEILSSATGGGGGEAMDVDSEGEKDEKGGYTGRVVYLLPGGIMSTDVMVKGGVVEGRGKIGEADFEIRGNPVGVWE